MEPINPLGFLAPICHYITYDLLLVYSDVLLPCQWWCPLCCVHYIVYILANKDNLKKNLGQIRRFLEPCDLEIWRMTLKNNRAPLLCYLKLYASFRNHRWIQAGVTVRKRPIWVKIDDFKSRVTLKFDVRPWKTIEHLFYATSSFVHHFVAIGDFKLELQSGNAQFGSNSMIFRAVWPCNLTYDLEKQ